MKLWMKLALLTMLTILLATGLFGSLVVYQAFQYNLSQTIGNYSGQVKANAFAVAQEINHSGMDEFGEVTRTSYLKYLMRKYGGNDYMLLQDGFIVCNETDYDLIDRTTPRWQTEEIEYEIQRMDGQHILVMGKQASTENNGYYQFVLVKDISQIYDDLWAQVRLFILLYAVVSAFAISIIFWVTKHMLRPLSTLQKAAMAISEGELYQRAKIRSRDEVATVGVAFNAMADQIENQVAELEEVSEQRKQLLGSLTHELKTPMTSIIGYSDTLLHVKINEEQQKKALEHINSECKRLERLSGKMMNLIGLYDNESISMVEYPVQSLLERVSTLESYHLQEKNMKLTISSSMNKFPMDVDLMESLLVNLIDNAIKASKEGDEIRVAAGNSRITVRDQGKGIPENEIPKITEAFYMVDKSRSKKAGGIGLGLALCRQIAELHHMHLEIESKLGEGTAVSVVLDQKISEEGVPNNAKEIL